MPGQLDRGQVDELIDGIRAVRRQLEILEPEQEASPPEEVVSERLVIDRINDLLMHLDGALEDWRDILQDRRDSEPRMALNFHRDLRAAWINGLRAFLSVAGTGAFWIATAWTPWTPCPGLRLGSDESLFLSTASGPDRLTFLKAGSVALFLALIFKYYLLPMSSEFEYLAVALGFVLLPWDSFCPIIGRGGGGRFFLRLCYAGPAS